MMESLDIEKKNWTASARVCHIIKDKYAPQIPEDRFA